MTTNVTLNEVAATFKMDLVKNGATFHAAQKSVRTVKNLTIETEENTVVCI